MTEQDRPEEAPIKTRAWPRRRRAAPPTGGLAFREDGLVSPSESMPILESLVNKNSVVGEELRFLATRVLEWHRERHLKCLALTSALPGEGKSTVGIGVAAALAREPGRRVLLLEADLRRPSLTRTLGLPQYAGLSEYLNGENEDAPVRLVSPGGFCLLVAGQKECDRPESLGAKRMDSLLRRARERFDFVVVDTTPLLPVTDAVLMQDLVDGFLMVVRSRQTPRDAIDEAMAKLRPGRLVGLVLNDHKVERLSYKRYGYQRYGMAYGQE